MLKVLGRLRPADETTRAAAHGIDLAGLLIDLAHSMRTADGTGLRKLVRHAFRLALVHHHIDDLRNDVPCPLHDDDIAEPDVPAFAQRFATIADALDIVLVVQRRIGDDDAADRDRFKASDRCQSAGAADLDVDAMQPRQRLFRGKFVRCRPARRTRTEA
jgi:hypothetical protein